MEVLVQWDTISSILQANTAAIDIVNAQWATYGQPYMVAVQAREDDIQALSELNCAFDKKVIPFIIY